MPKFSDLARGLGRTLFGKDDPATAPIARAVPTWQTASPLTPLQDYRTMLDRGYRRNVVVYCCIQEIATSVSHPKLRAVNPQGEEVQPDHPMLKLLKRPNPTQSRYEFFEALATNLQATGNAYVHKVRNRMKMPVQLWNLRPDRIKIKPAADGTVEYYEYRLEDKVFNVPSEDVIHLKLHDPLDDYYGLAPLAVAARAIDLDDQALDYLRAFFVNGAAPAGLLKLSEPVEPEERERIKQQWREMYGSQRGWHELAVLDATAEFQEIGSRPQKLGMDAIWGVTESRICAAFGVPPVLVQMATGIAASTFSNYKEALKSFWEETLVPMYARIADALTMGLAPEFSGDLELEWDLSKIAVLNDGRAETFNLAVAGWNAGLLSKNQSLEMMGLPAIPGGDDEYKQQGGPPGMGPMGPGGPMGPDGAPQPPPPVADSESDDPEAEVDDDEDGDEDVNDDGVSGNSEDGDTPKLVKKKAPPKSAFPPKSTKKGQAKEEASRFRAPLVRPRNIHATGSTPYDWTEVQRLAEQAEPEFREAFLAAVEAARDRGNLSALIRAIESRNVQAALKASGWSVGGSPVLAKGMRDAIRSVMKSSGTFTVDALPDLLPSIGAEFSMRFDMKSARALDWIESRSAEMVKYVDDEQRDAIKYLMETSFEDGIEPREIARYIKDYVGILPQHQGALAKYESSLRSSGDYDDDEIAEKVADKADDYLTFRAQMIARTETIKAAYEGQREAWRQADDKDLLPDTAIQQWIAAGDERTCDLCGPLHGATAGLDEPFDEDGEIYQPGDTHPQCRCAIVMRPYGVKDGGDNTDDDGNDEPVENTDYAEETAAMPPVETFASHSFSSTQVDLPPLAAIRVIAAASELIPDEALMGKGREMNPHVTVLYGLHTENAGDVALMLEYEKPISFTLGKTIAFPPSDSSDGCAVIVCEVKSTDLERLNFKLRSGLDCTSSYDYIPHVTLAYVRPESARRFVGNTSLAGMNIVTNSITFSDRDGNKTPLELGLRLAAAAPSERHEWDEEAHPRDERGRFGEGGGGDKDSAPSAEPGPNGYTSEQVDKAFDHAQSTFESQYRADPSGMVDKYLEQNKSGSGSYVINADLAKGMSSEYNANNDSRALLAGAVHETASNVSKAAYKEALSRPVEAGHERAVFFTAGGGGAGKSTGLQSSEELKKLESSAHAVVDGVLSNADKASAQIDYAIDKGFKVSVALTERDYKEAWDAGVIPRANREGRMVPPDAFADGHAKVYSAFATLMDKYKDNPNVSFHLVDNTHGKGGAKVYHGDEARARLRDPKNNAAAIKEYAQKSTESLFKAGKLKDSAAIAGMGKHRYMQLLKEHHKHARHKLVRR